MALAASRRRPPLPPPALALLLLLARAPPSASWRQYKAWSTRNWCEQAIDPLWPWAYSKTALQDEASLNASGALAAGTVALVGFEAKGRTASNYNDMGHECTTFGALSRCSICETFACGDTFDAT